MANISTTIIVVAFGGSLGAVMRWGLSTITYRYAAGGFFPWGTLAVNLSGSFLIGFLWEAMERTAASQNFKAFVFIGLLGAFTTFSTYSIENFNLIRDGEVKSAAINIVASNVLGIGLVFAGFGLSRFIFTAIR